MPITPRYSLTQTSARVQIEVSIPHVRVSTSTLDLVIVDGTDLHLHAPPTYLLKLALPGRVVDEDAVEESLALASTGSGAAIRVLETSEGTSTATEECTSSTSTPSARIWTKEDLPKLQYDPEKNHGTLVVTLRKEQEGLWQDLDLLGRLQQPTHKQKREKPSPRERATKPLIEVVDEDNKKHEGEDDIDSNDENDATTFDAMEDLLSVGQKRPTYGLFQHFSNVFRDYAREGLAREMLECPNPDEVYSDNGTNNDAEQQSRREIRLEMESEKFDSDRYLNDLHIEEEGDMIFDAAMMMVPHWAGNSASQNSAGSIDGLTARLSNLSTSDGQNAFFTAEESHLLATLPPQRNVPTQLTAEQKRSGFLSLTDIIFAYAYDHRTTDGDPTVESSWTLMILSPTLSWLEHYNPPYDTVVDVARWSFRRSLIYPYLRSYTFARKIVDDVCQILKGGRRTVIRCLLQLHRIMEKSENHYLFNKLFIDPLIGWIQRCGEDEVTSFANEVVNVLKINTGAESQDILGKESLGLCLIELEKSFFECCSDDKSVTSDDSDDLVDYESDSDSRGVDEETVSTTADEDESRDPDKSAATPL